MIKTEQTMWASLPSTEFKQQALVITVPTDHKTVSNNCQESFPPQSSSSNILQYTHFSDVNNLVNKSNASVNDEMECQVACSSVSSTVESDSKTPQKILRTGFSKVTKIVIK